MPRSMRVLSRSCWIEWRPAAENEPRAEEFWFASLSARAKQPLSKQQANGGGAEGKPSVIPEFRPNSVK
jgi:hypothetical protein